MIRPMTEADFPSVYELVKATGTLDVHTPYTYWVMLNLRTELTLVCERDGQMAGFVAGLAPFRELDEALVWQIGVWPHLQRRGVGAELIEAFTASALSQGFRYLCATITPSNQPSLQFFSALADRSGTDMQQSGVTGSMRGHMREETIYRIAIA